MAVTYNGSRKLPRKRKSVAGRSLASLKKSSMLMMNSSVVSFQRPMNTLTMEGSVVLTALGSSTVILVWKGDRPRAMAASFCPESTA